MLNQRLLFLLYYEYLDTYHIKAVVLKFVSRWNLSIVFVKHYSLSLNMEFKMNWFLFQIKKITNITADQGKVFSYRALVAVGNGNGLAGKPTTRKTVLALYQTPTIGRVLKISPLSSIKDEFSAEPSGAPNHLKTFKVMI